STGLPTNVSTSCIEVGTNDNNLVVTFSNYGVNNIWVTTNGGTSWTNIDGNLPDMPVRWALFKPGDNTKMIIATETGVWFSDLINGASTVWVSSPTFPLVKATMLQYRSSDQMILASTHGRGLWTQPIYSILPLNNFMLRARWSSAGNVELVWDFEESNTGGAFTIEYSSDGQTFQNGGNVATISGRDNYRYQHQPMQTNILYRIKHTSSSGKTLYSNIVKLSGGSYNTSIQITSLYPNPVKSNLTFVFSNAEKGNINYTISNMAGQVVLRKAETLSFVGSNSKTWDINTLSAGSYILTANMGNQKASIKFIKQ
ncbi:MAG TPA: T9SS type A sorting domain-containing protein, partial [Chitinophagaceae bacterium]|nr:T9SS type A sorting domain-containing protein [Chitinophagaceae bacterium]